MNENERFQQHTCQYMIDCLLLPYSVQLQHYQDLDTLVLVQAVTFVLYWCFCNHQLPKLNMAYQYIFVRMWSFCIHGTSVVSPKGKINLEQEWLLAFWNKPNSQTHKRFKRTLILLWQTDNLRLVITLDHPHFGFRDTDSPTSALRRAGCVVSWKLNVKGACAYWKTYYKNTLFC